jgi:RHS repeat-associated protein
VVNEVQRTYNEFSQLAIEYQAHGGAVDTGTTPKVLYNYADGSDNTIRPTEMVYPDNTGGNRKVGYIYQAFPVMNDKLSRVERLTFDNLPMVGYKYLGLDTFVYCEYIDIEIGWRLISGGSPNPYAALDRFGRIVQNGWYDFDEAGTLDDIRYTYDRASNRTTRENMVAKAQTTPQYYDELYGYDGSNRLTTMKRGQLASLVSITNLQFQQDWGLDDTGNWQEFNEDSNGDGTNDLVQARTANPVNEITDITNMTGAAWVQPGYDAAGNMTTIPQGNEPAEGFTGVYDAWNRLVKLTDEAENPVAEYAYDGLTRRITKTTSEVRHYYYNASWQILEERVGSATTFDRQYVWGLRYIDDCVLRDRKLTSSVERRHVLQDANWNVTAITESSDVVERYSYSAYSMPTFLNPDFTVKAGSDYGWDVLYAGYKWDSESGMYQVRFRYLLPNIGSWSSRDPIEYISHGYNFYTYANNMALNYIDPSGLLVETAAAGGAAVAGGTAAAPVVVIVGGTAVASYGSYNLGYWIGENLYDWWYPPQQPVNPPVNPPVKQPVNPPVKQPAKERAKEPAKEPDDVLPRVKCEPRRDDPDDPCVGFYDECIKTGLNSKYPKDFAGRCWTCRLACQGKNGMWTEKMNGLDCKYW